MVDRQFAMSFISQNNVFELDIVEIFVLFHCNKGEKPSRKSGMQENGTSQRRRAWWGEVGGRFEACPQADPRFVLIYAGVLR
jgi:hypothetical protein